MIDYLSCIFLNPAALLCYAFATADLIAHACGIKRLDWSERGRSEPAVPALPQMGHDYARTGHFENWPSILFELCIVLIAQASAQRGRDEAVDNLVKCRIDSLLSRSWPLNPEPRFLRERRVAPNKILETGNFTNSSVSTRREYAARSRCSSLELLFFWAPPLRFISGWSIERLYECRRMFRKSLPEDGRSRR